MPEIISSAAFVWENGASLFSNDTVLQWQEGASIYSEGGAFTPASPPAGGTATAPNLDARTVVSAATYYNAGTDWAVTDLRDGQPVEVDSLSFSTDEDALFWAVALSGGQALYDKLAAGDQPPSVAVVLGDQEWRFVIEDLPLQRKHGEVQARARGRSLTCLAGAPYELDQNWSLSGDTTALQLATAANLGTELQVEWGLTDWPVPDGVFSHSGTPLSVVKRIADAVGAMVQSDPREYSVKVLPRYDLLPNEWPVVPPDVEIAEDAIESDGYEDASKPAYDGVYVFGQQGGAAAFVRLAGTSGANLKPMVTDALLTHVDACSQRGMAELARSGEQRRHTLSMPVYSGSGQPGVLTVGRIVKIASASPWWGIVRSVSVQARHGDTSQTVVVERHTRLVDGLIYGSGITSPLRFEGPIPAQTVTTGTVFDLNLSAYFAAGVPAYAYFMRSGALPSWLELNRNTGHVIGTAPSSPVAVATVRFRATDSINSTADTNDVAITVVSAEVHLSAIGLNGRRVAQANSYSSTWTLPGSDAPFYWGSDEFPSSAAYNGTALVVGGQDVAGTYAGAVYRSLDRGATWTFAAGFDFPVQTPRATMPSVDSLTIPSGDRGRVFHTSYGFVVPLVSTTPGVVKNATSSDGLSWSVSTLSTFPIHADTHLAQLQKDGDSLLAIVNFPGTEFPSGGGAPFSDATCYVVESTNGGATWSARFSADPAVFVTTRVVTGGGVILLIGNPTFAGTTTPIKRSASGWGGTWTNHSIPGRVGYGKVAYGNGKFVAIRVGEPDTVHSSADGVTWTTTSIAALNDGNRYILYDLIFSGNEFLGVYGHVSGTGGTVIRSTNGVTWTAHAGPNITPTKLIATP